MTESTRKMPFASRAECALYDEAIRLLPAIAAAKLREDDLGINELYDQYCGTAVQLGVRPSRRWIVYSTAALAWVTRLLQERSDILQVPVDETAMELVGAALTWTAARHA